MQVADECLLRGNEGIEEKEKNNNWRLRRNRRAIQGTLL